jgi:nicotinamidase-related amidase
MTNGDTWLVIIDMQNVFASGPITWRCPDFGKIIEPIRRLAADYPGRTLLTRFVDAPQKAGSWVQYYKESAFANVPESNCMYEIVTALQDLITADNVVTRTTFNKWDGILSKTGPYPHLLLAGVATDCCVLSTALQAAEAGAFVTVALNACAGSSPENQMAAERILRGYKPLIQVTGT